MRKSLKNFQYCILALKVLLILSLVPSFNQVHAQTIVSGNQSGTWTKANSPYIINGTVLVPTNETLIIQPGVEIKSSNYQDAIIIRGTLKSKGTLSDSIRFRGFANPSLNVNSTHGGRIHFESTSINSELEYVTIDRWGDVDVYGGDQGAIRISSGSLSISKSNIRNSEKTGMYINAGAISPKISETNFTGNEKSVYTYASSVSGISNCSNARIVLINTTMTSNCLIPKPGIDSYYELENGFTISTSTITTIQLGVEIRSMNYNDAITVKGTLIAKGTAADSIYFKGYANPSAATYSTHGGRIFIEGSSTNSALEYVSIDQLGDVDVYGGDRGTISISSGSFSISKSNIRNSEKTGIYILANSITPTISNVLFQNIEQPIQAYPSSVGGISNCPNTIIHIINGSTGNASLIPKPGINSYYQLNGGFTIPQNTTTTIQPGVEVRSINYNDAITVNGTLIAKGTISDSIRFTGFANPSVNANSTHGGRIYFQGASTNTKSQLEYVVVDRWGDADIFNGDKGALSIYSGAFSISKSCIRNSEKTGIYILAAYITPIISGVKFQNIEKAILTYPSSVGGISDCPNTAIHLSDVYMSNAGAAFNMPWPGVNSYYQLNGGFAIPANVTATIQPKVEIRSNSYQDAITVNGTLKAKGTATDSIYFRGFANPSLNANSTHGGRIYFQSTSLITNSELEYVSIDRWGDVLGGDRGAINVAASALSISKSCIRNSERIGISFSSLTAVPQITQNTFSENTIDISAYPSTCSGILNNENAKITINSGWVNSNATWPYPGTNSFYTLTERVFVNPNYSLTIGAGSLIDFGEVGAIEVDGTLIAQGTQVAPIQFVRMKSSLDYYATSRIFLKNTSSNSIFSYVNFDKLGATGWNHYASLQIETPSFSINNITISNSYYSGLYYSASGFPLVQNSIFINNKTGVHIGATNNSGKLLLNNCNIWQYGVRNQ